MFRPIWDWDSSARCTCIAKLMFTSGLEPSIICFKYQRVNY
ncbi:unnamed protein product [Schistosoma margrebowiei]|uniref:Uncharacterized protein n=1 Tax=Schistosoma margrebowiei TaxID=48269 RepID=A0A183LWS2_9TREM|nr:unnamed protein product [Schistosoma margrebowiei]